MVSVYTRRLIKGDVYYARFKITNKSVADGQRYVTESLNTTIEAVAHDRARQRYAEICLLETENKSLKTGTVKVEIDGFIAQYEDGVRKGLKGYSEHMLTGFRKSIVRYFVEYLGSKALRDVSADDLKGYESWRHDYWADRIVAGKPVHGNVKTKPSQRTIEWEMNAFKQFLRWAAEQGDYSGNALNFKFSVDKKHSRSAFTDFQAKRSRVVVDADGRRERAMVPARVKQWWWKASDGKLLFTVQYGTKALELAKGKPAIEVSSMQELVDALQSVRAAAEAGELDSHIETASASLGLAFKRKAPKTGGRAS